MSGSGKSSGRRLFTAGETAIATAARVLAEIELLERRLAGEDLRRPAAASGHRRVRGTGVDFTGVVLSKLDGDARGGAALSVASITGRPITGLTSQDADVLHAGTRLDGDQFVASGGRVLVVLGHGETLAGARQEAYQNISEIQLDGGFHRDDIAAAAAEQEAVAGLASGNSSHEAPRHAAATPEEPPYRNTPSTN